MITDTFNESLKKGLIKNDFSDHFPIFFSINTDIEKLQIKKQVILKRWFSEVNIASFNEQLSLLIGNINFSSEANVVYNSFFRTFYEVYDANFPQYKVNLNKKSLKSPWITKELRKSSKVKQKLYIKYLMSKTDKNKEIYKSYVKLFESQKKT
jgi:hypothetical protein